MALNYVWIGFLLIGFMVGLAKTIFLGQSALMSEMLAALFDPADLVSSSGSKVSSGKSGSSLPGWLKDAFALHPFGLGL